MSIIERLLMTMALIHHPRERGENGASTVEYALLISGVVVFVTAALVILGPKISAVVSGVGL